jgi:hypothetical protein
MSAFLRHFIFFARLHCIQSHIARGLRHTPLFAATPGFRAPSAPLTPSALISPPYAIDITRLLIAIDIEFSSLSFSAFSRVAASSLSPLFSFHFLSIRVAAIRRFRLSTAAFCHRVFFSSRSFLLLSILLVLLPFIAFRCRFRQSRHILFISLFSLIISLRRFRLFLRFSFSLFFSARAISLLIIDIDIDIFAS